MKRSITALTLTTLICITALAAEPPTTEPASQPAEQASPDVRRKFGLEDSIDDAPMPTGRIENVSVQDFLERYKKWLPNFRYIIYREPSVTGRGPILPTMDTTELRFAEFVDFVNASCPGVHIQADHVADPQQVCPLYVVTLSVPAADVRAHVKLPTVVKVFSMTEAIRMQQVLHNEDQKKATDDVLSLIQTVIDESPGGNQASMRVHEETDSLIFKGPESISGEVGEAIQSIATHKIPVDPQITEELEEDRSKLAQFQKREQELMQHFGSSPELTAVREQIARLRKSIDELKVRQAAFAAGTTRPSN
jgi:hypothetical protein